MSVPPLRSMHPVRELGLEPGRKAPVGGVIKRAVDICLASTALLLLAPILVVIALLVVSTSRGPALFVQRRVGYRGRVFLIYKFRSMTACEDGDVVNQATSNDSRVTMVGCFLRRSSLDELPQLLNVLRGDMSMVGPRPHAVTHDRRFQTLAADYSVRRQARPGITGLAQVNGFRGEIFADADVIGRAKRDAEYVRRWSIWMDARIIAATAFLVLREFLPSRKKVPPVKPAQALGARVDTPFVVQEGAETFPILGIPISVTNLDQACATIHRWARDDRARFVHVRDAASLMASLDDPELFELNRRAAMVTPDGMPLVWLGRLAGRKLERTCGPDLMDKMLLLSAESRLRHYFYGGRDGIAETLRDRFVAKYPGVRVVGVGTPPFRPLTGLELQDVAGRINRSKADVVWIGISSPKQEFLMRDLEPFVHCTMVGVGAAFDFHSGAVKRAPKWMQRSGLEWAWRLASEPRRLWKRYLVLVPRLGFRLLTASIAGRA